MRRDLVRVYQADLEDVFEAYVRAAKEKFGKECKIEYYHTINFGLNYSFKYNMNGGSCTVHLMPYNGGTAVDTRYSIAQLGMAKYKKHEQDLTDTVQSFLGVRGQSAMIPIEVFLDPANQVQAPSGRGTYETKSAPVSASAPVFVSAPVPAATQVQRQPQNPINVRVQNEVDPSIPVRKGNFCPRCGHASNPGAKFCGKCGNKL